MNDEPLVAIGEGFAGAHSQVAHVNTVYGHRRGPVGHAFATSLATQTAGHNPFVCVHEPGLAVVPPTLFINKATYAGTIHQEATWGPVQAGIAEGVRDALIAGHLPQVDDCCLVIAVWVSPAVQVDDFEALHANNRCATFDALRAGSLGLPRADALIHAGAAWNPFYPTG